MFAVLKLVSLLSLVLYSAGFRVGRHSSRAARLFSTVDVEPTEIEEVITPKSILLDDAFKSRTELNEIVSQLEKQNPTVDPAYSPLLNGVWELAVTGITSPSLVVYQILKLVPSSIVETSNVTLTITSVSPRVTAASTVKIGTVKIDVKAVTDITALTGTQLNEEYKSGKINNFEVPLSSVSILNRELLITYLDDDLLIVRDFLGSPEILRRSGKPLLSPSATTTVPSVTDDNGAPGSS